MDIYQKILKMIESFDTIIIHRHMRPDMDAIGSQYGYI
jgi:phosphoesterase RecJ-like protein